MLHGGGVEVVVVVVVRVVVFPFCGNLVALSWWGNFTTLDELPSPSITNQYLISIHQPNLQTRECPGEEEFETLEN
jgi:hypothetical protein